MADGRIEAFVKDVLDLEGGPYVGDGVRTLLADYEKNFPDIMLSAYHDRVVEQIARQIDKPKRHLYIVLAAIKSGSRLPKKVE